jgi:hypothetical protein
MEKNSQVSLTLYTFVVLVVPHFILHKAGDGDYFVGCGKVRFLYSRISVA